MTYETWHQIRRLRESENLSARQIAIRLSIDPRTVGRALKMPVYKSRVSNSRTSLLDPYKGVIVGKLEQHGDYSATQLYQMIGNQGYTGGYGLVKRYVGEIRPRLKPVYQRLRFEPGECAQVDWGSWKSVKIGDTRRRLSFFVMVLCHSRLLYVEFALSEKQDHWLTCHRNALEYFGGVPRKIMVDNCKTAVLSHQRGAEAVVNPHYAEFASHYGFKVVPCGVRRPNEKGRVENAVGYVKKNFLAGRGLEHYSALCWALREWLEVFANQRCHGTTGKIPRQVFLKEERQSLYPLPVMPYDCGVNVPSRSNNQAWVPFETNLYTVPIEYASCQLTLRRHPERVLLYHKGKLIADHPRCYDRRREVFEPGHHRELATQNRHARDQKVLRHFLHLSPMAEPYYNQLRERRPNCMKHLRRIVALTEVYGEDKVALALEDANEHGAFSCEYVLNILEARASASPEPGALHLTRKQDMLEIKVPEPDMSVYDKKGNTP